MIILVFLCAVSLIPSDQSTVWDEISSYAFCTSPKRSVVFTLGHNTDGVAFDTFDYWRDDLDCLIVPVSFLAFFALHVRSRLLLCWYRGFVQPLFLHQKSPNERRNHSSLLPQPSILNAISNIFSCDMVHLVSQQLILEEGMDLTGQRCSQTLTHAHKRSPRCSQSKCLF